MLFVDRSLKVCLLLIVKDFAPFSVSEAWDVVVVRPDVGFNHLFPGGRDGVGLIGVPFYDMY